MFALLTRQKLQKQLKKHRHTVNTTAGGSKEILLAGRVFYAKLLVFFHTQDIAENMLTHGLIIGPCYFYVLKTSLAQPVGATWMNRQSRSLQKPISRLRDRLDRMQKRCN